VPRKRNTRLLGLSKLIARMSARGLDTLRAQALQVQFELLLDVMRADLGRLQQAVRADDGALHRPSR
jgi:hypothetical protein